MGLTFWGGEASLPGGWRPVQASAGAGAECGCSRGRCGRPSVQGAVGLLYSFRSLVSGGMIVPAGCYVPSSSKNSVVYIEQGSYHIGEPRGNLSPCGVVAALGAVGGEYGCSCRRSHTAWDVCFCTIPELWSSGSGRPGVCGGKKPSVRDLPRGRACPRRRRGSQVEWMRSQPLSGSGLSHD